MADINGLHGRYVIKAGSGLRNHISPALFPISCRSLCCEIGDVGKNVGMRTRWLQCKWDWQQLPTPEKKTFQGNCSSFILEEHTGNCSIVNIDFQSISQYQPRASPSRGSGTWTRGRTKWLSSRMGWFLSMLSTCSENEMAQKWKQKLGSILQRNMLEYSSREQIANSRNDAKNGRWEYMMNWTAYPKCSIK